MARSKYAHRPAATQIGKKTEESRGSDVRDDTKNNAVVSYDTNHPPRPGRSYAELERAYDYLNFSLFGNELPSCLITFQRHRHCYGYFSGSRFINPEEPTEVADEIALNPEYFVCQTPEGRLSTLAHEMVHLWQHHFGKPSRGGYHNREWARKMVEIGLFPSSTGEPGGRLIGEAISHYIQENGPFDRACKEFLALCSTTFFQDIAAIFQAVRDQGEREGLHDHEETEELRDRKRRSKTRYACTGCGLKAWAKHGVLLICGHCERGMAP
jgi:predicted SprT family Zn-dependent metalloprotease